MRPQESTLESETLLGKRKKGSNSWNNKTVPNRKKGSRVDERGGPMKISR